VSERAYAGIGSRRTPAPTLRLMRTTAASAATRGWVLRTGLSPGADQAFYRGALTAGGGVELYLPCPEFESHARLPEEGAAVRELVRPSAAAYELAARTYRAWDRPRWSELGPGDKALLARDCHQVLGARLDSPAACVVCWTPDAGLDGADPRAGGTGQALRLAARHAIPVLNLGRPEHAAVVRALGLPA
jgi:hypothetical protein